MILWWLLLGGGTTQLITSRNECINLEQNHRWLHVFGVQTGHHSVDGPWVRWGEIMTKHESSLVQIHPIQMRAWEMVKLLKSQGLKWSFWWKKMSMIGVLWLVFENHWRGGVGFLDTYNLHNKRGLFSNDIKILSSPKVIPKFIWVKDINLPQCTACTSCYDDRWSDFVCVCCPWHL